MKLSCLLRDVEYEGRYEKDCEITLVTDDSRRVRPGALYVCIKHRSFDGHSAAVRALDSGAAAVITQMQLGLKNELVVGDTRRMYCELCAAFYGHPERSMTFVGVTGTNGKTTVTHLVRGILEPYSLRCGLIGTVENILGDASTDSSLTTPEPPELYSLLSRMRDQGCGYCVMEVSSQALDQGRVAGICFDIAVFTNLTRDHLDYHGSFEKYLEAKQKLFTCAKRALINLDDPYSSAMAAACAGSVAGFSCSLPCADYLARDIMLKASSVSFTLAARSLNLPIDFASPGMFSVSNALAAAACALELGVPADFVSGALRMTPPVRGRLERVECPLPFAVLIDYAHTPDGLEQVLRALRTQAGGRLILLFGCGGDRDREKRPLMGSAASRYADTVIVTSDNPRGEEPERIIADILEGVDTEECRLLVEPDRRAAIALALGVASPGDTVLLAGKGHEAYQIKGDKKVPFDEREIVRELSASE